MLDFYLFIFLKKETMVTLCMSGHIISWKREGLGTKLHALLVCIALDCIYIIPLCL